VRKRGDRPTLRETQLRTKTHRNVPSWTNRHLPATMATPPPHDARNITNVTNSKHLHRTDSAATSCVHELDLVANDALNSSQTGKIPRALYCNNLPNSLGFPYYVQEEFAIHRTQCQSRPPRTARNARATSQSAKQRCVMDRICLFPAVWV